MTITRLDKCRTLIKNNPTKSATELYNEAKDNKFGIRKKDFLKEVRDIRKLPEPTKVKKNKSTPLKYRKKLRKPTPKKKGKIKPIPVKVPFEKTKFGQIVKDLQKKHGISEKRAIERARALLKIPKKDYKYLNQKDVLVLSQYGY